MSDKVVSIKKKSPPPTDILDRFLDVVFGDLTSVTGEHICFWSNSNNRVGYPKDLPNFKKALRGKKKQACYFGTATMHLTEDSELRNRQANFGALYVMVLDDIGSGPGAKLPFESLPDGLINMATYRIETSPDNYQIGFVLKEAIEDLEIAKELVKLFVGASGADTGGCMPNKLVRLPVGVNLKDKYETEDGEPFEMNITGLNAENLCDVDELLSAVGAGVTYKDIEQGS